MKRYLKQIKSLKKINKSNITSNKFLVNKEDNIKIYYAPFDYINPKAKIMIVGITPGLQQMLQSFEVVIVFCSHKTYSISLHHIDEQKF